VQYYLAQAVPNELRVAVTEEWKNYITPRSLNYYSGGQIKKSEMGGTCSTYGESRGVYRILVGKPEGNRTLKIRA
jgi:hypothetical protein